MKWVPAVGLACTAVYRTLSGHDNEVTVSSVSTNAKNDRLEARITSEQKAILARAASIQGRSLTDFVVTSASEAAQRVIRDAEVLELSARDQAAFAEALRSPAAPNAALAEAARRYLDAKT